MTTINKKKELDQRLNRLSHSKRTQKHGLFSLPLALLFLMVGSLAFLAFQNSQKEPIVSLSADNMNIFYYGMENSITVAVEGELNEDVKVTSKTLILKSLGNGKYQVEPLKIGKAIITVEASSTKKDLEFEVQRFPTPIIANMSRNHTNTKISAKKMKSMKGIEIEDLPNFDKACTIVSYDLSRMLKNGDALVVENKGSVFQEIALKFVKTAKKGDVFYVDNLQVKCIDDEKPRKMEGLSFRVME